MRISAILASPHFLYRAESGAGTGATRTLSDLELASRLSFFLWSSLPDEELLKLATESRLSKPDVLAAQVSRMLADPRAKSLSDDFAFQWLHLSKLDEITPDRTQFPHASRLLDPRGMFKEELRLFIDSVLRPSAYSGRPERSRGAERSQRVRTADGGLHLPQRAAGDALRHRDGEGQPLPSRDARQPGATRPAGKGRHPDADRVSQSHLARAAWRLDTRSPSRRAAARTASQRPDAAGEQARSAGAHAAGEARAAPRESDVCRVPRRDGSARTRAGEFQRGRSVPGERPRHADANRCHRSAAGRHGDQRT